LRQQEEGNGKTKDNPPAEKHCPLVAGEKKAPKGKTSYSDRKGGEKILNFLELSQLCCKVFI